MLLDFVFLSFFWERRLVGTSICFPTNQSADSEIQMFPIASARWQFLNIASTFWSAAEGNACSRDSLRWDILLAAGVCIWIDSLGDPFTGENKAPGFCSIARSFNCCCSNNNCWCSCLKLASRLCWLSTSPLNFFVAKWRLHWLCWTEQHIDR